jgi:hypothetical protein
MSEDGTILQNLKGRHVVRAAIAHVIVAWLFVQIADVVLPYLGIVDQPVRWALAVSIATFPITLVLAWLLDQPWMRVSATRVTAEIVVIALIAVLAGLWVRGNLPEAARMKTNIVILPFTHSGAAADQGLSRALAYEVVSLLTRSRSIDVIGFESSNSAALQGLGTMAVAERLNVGNVLSGSVNANRIGRIAAADCRSDRYLQEPDSEVPGFLGGLRRPRVGAALPAHLRSGECDSESI